MNRNSLTLDHEIAARIDAFNDGRQVRALFGDHIVRNDRGDGRYVVESGTSGNEYRVSLATGECECPDAENHRICKHQFAAMYATGAAVLPVDVLDADAIAVDVIRDDDNEIVDLDLVDHYKSINLETDASVTRVPRWATEDGEIIETVTASEPEPGDAIDAERALVEEQSQQAAADGGAERCGAETADGSPCERKGQCPYHDDEPAQQASTEPEIDASASADTSVSEAFANVATTDGGAVIDPNGSTDVIDRVLERADGDVTVIVINQ